MTNLLHAGESRSQTILRHTQQAIREGALKVLPFSEVVADHYLADVAPEQRTVSLREQGEAMETALAAKKHNGQVIDRLVRGIVKYFPADLEDAWVDSLPQPFRDLCEQDLAARRGHVPVKDPRDAQTVEQQTADLAALLHKVGSSATALAPIFADGKVDMADLPHIGPALEQLGALITSTLQLHQRLTGVVLDAHGAPINVTPLRRA